MEVRDLQVFLHRLWPAGPLLYLGLALMFDPAALVRKFGALQSAIDEMSDAFLSRDIRWRRDRTPEPVSLRTERTLRVVGAAIAVAAFLQIAAL